MKGRQNMRRYVLVLLTIVLLSAAVLSGCGGSNQSAQAGGAQKELLIYCGITMMQPMQEIANVVEEQENCKITILPGGSGDLLEKLKEDQKGDLFLPGSDSYIKTAEEELLVDETVHVGYNKAALLVQEGNPKGIPADLDSLLNEEYVVVIGNPDSGSIGKETRKILTNKGIFEMVMERNPEVRPESEELMQALADKEADLTINWYAVSTWSENASKVDALPIDEQYAQPKKLVLGLLKSSENPDLARKFMEYAASDKGRELFNKYGLYDIE
jgi:molybdate transport system substrate-binding protein